MLLAAAVHRCWPINATPPVVADLGQYILLGSESDLPPRFLGSGGIVLLQDVTEKENVTGKLVNFIRKQSALVAEQEQGESANLRILAQISFVRLREELEATRVTAIEETWASTVEPNGRLPLHDRGPQARNSKRA